MSLDELRDDLKRNMADLNSVDDTTTRDHLRNTLWPFLEAIVDVVEEMDDAVAELVDQQEDYLQPDTAAIFAAVVQTGIQMGAELKKRAAGDAAVMQLVAQHEQFCAQAVDILGSITMVPNEDEEEDTDEDETDQEMETQMLEVETDEPEAPPPPPDVDVSELSTDELEPEPDKKEKRAPAMRETKAMAEMRNNTDAALKEWMESLSPNGGVKVRVTRTSPKIWKSMQVGGSLATYDHYIDEDWIREHHGGGNFMLEVKKPRTNGSGWQIAGSRAIQIAGDPRTDDVFRDKGPEAAAPASTANDGLVKTVLGSMERQLERAQQQAQQPSHHGPDVATLQMLLAPLQAQIEQMNAMLREKDQQLAAIQQQQNKPPERSPMEHEMFSALLQGDSARVVSMRTQHESEVRQLKQSAIDDEKRLRDSFDRDRQSIDMAHDREMNALRSSYDMKVVSQETLSTSIKTLLEGEIRRLEAALTEARTELIALRAKKDKTIIEQATEFAQIKEAIGDITGEDKGEKSTMEKIMEVAGNLPAVQGLIGKLGEQPQQQPAQAPQQVRRSPPLLTGPDGNIYRQLPDGQMQLVRERKKPQPQQTPGQPNIPEIPAATVKIAVDFLETAYRNGQDPAEVATSVRSMIPADVLTAIRELGIDGFLSSVAKLDATSPLSAQAGRNWTRKLGKSLIEG